ncbi:uncharacterized protein LOC127865780 isoform X1 [Dreissena polymorpha]|nr:uncharacterized protein LOC127865780 isoform X1 [Dreissena polymorpha]
MFDRCVKIQTDKINMGTQIRSGLIAIIFGNIVPGVAASGSNIGGLIAAAVISFFCLVAAVVMVFIAFLWRDWYLKRQLQKGKRRVARNLAPLRLWRSRSKPSLNTTPASARRIIGVASRESTMNRQQLIRGDSWFSQVQGGKRFEEKVQTIELEAEEDDVVVAEIMPDENNIRSTQHLRTTYTQQTTPTSYVTTRLGDEETSFSRPNGTTTTDTVASGLGNTYYVPISKGPAASAASQMSQTTAPSRISYEPYHVHSAHLSQTTRPQNGNTDIFITPLIPTSSKRAAMMEFDSDEEAGNVPNPKAREEVDVLF